MTCKLWHFHICSHLIRISPSAPLSRCRQKARLSCLEMIMNILMTMIIMMNMTMMMKMPMSMMGNRQQLVARWREGSSCIRGRPSQGQSRRRRRTRSPEEARYHLQKYFSHLNKHLVALKVPRLAKEPGCVHVQTPRCPVSLLQK